MASQIISRADAKANGLTRYFTNLPCKHGHFAERVTANGGCVTCGLLITKKWASAHPERQREKWRRQAARHRIENPERVNRNKDKWVLSNPAKRQEISLRWTRANPEKVAAIGKKWRENNRDKHLAKIRKWHEANPLTEEKKVAAVQRTKQWCIDNPDRAKELKRRVRQIRRARKLNAGGSYTQKQIDELLIKQNHTCVYCPTPLDEKRELDHWVSLKRGGSNDISNLQWLCVSCNRKKRDLDPIEFEASIGFVRTFPPGL